MDHRHGMHRPHYTANHQLRYEIDHFGKQVPILDVRERVCHYAAFNNRNVAGHNLFDVLLYHSSVLSKNRRRFPLVLDVAHGWFGVGVPVAPHSWYVQGSTDLFLLRAFTLDAVSVRRNNAPSRVAHHESVGMEDPRG